MQNACRVGDSVSVTGQYLIRISDSESEREEIN